MIKKITLTVVVVSSIWLAVIWSVIQLDIDTYFLQPDVRLPDGGQYYGEHQKGLFSGKGRLIWPGGESYHGSFENGVFSGFGRLQMLSGDYYEGEFVDGLLSGQGKLITDDDDIYEGGFENYEPEGHGSWAFKDGSSYVGEFTLGHYHGEGSYDGVNGESYTGQFQEGYYHGNGEINYENGNSYLGSFERGDYDGTGRFTTVEGKVYDGTFENGDFSGKGNYLDGDGNYYDGEFEGWQFHGKGKYVDKEGNIYQGEFVDGQLEGKGTYSGSDGEVYDGEFENWYYDGDGELTSANGDRYQGEFSYGNYNGMGTINYAQPQDGVSELVGEWQWGSYTGLGNGPSIIESNVEIALYNQNKLLETAIGNVLPTEKDKINLYFVGVGGDGKQDVFYKEVSTVQTIFDHSFDTAQRSVILANNLKSIDEAALATTQSLTEVLQGLDQKMDVENDILFLFLTSHGSKDHRFVLDQQGMELADLSAKTLGRIIDESAVKWKVIVVSACYSGGFIPELEDENTLVITAADDDRKSFGCSDDADMTYFGRAFFQDSINETESFVAAFENAKDLVKERELEHVEDEGAQHSKPQISTSAPISQHLQRWRNQLQIQRQGVVQAQVQE